jgi:ABC-type Fe3+/spermidine/putrescine transport system ATPase subunit
MHAVAGFVSPAEGEVWLAGRRVASRTESVPPERRDLAMVFQNYALWPHLSALDTVAYPDRRRGVSRTQARQQAMSILERLHIAQLALRRPAELSGGEQQRVGLARALARRSALYLFDEPTAHLDTQVRGVFLEELLTKQRDTGAAALYATHDPEEALGLADRVALLWAGRVLQVGTPEQVYNEPVDAKAAGLTGPVSVIAAPDGRERLLVRPDWATLDGARSTSDGNDRTVPWDTHRSVHPSAGRPGRVREVWFRGPHADYLLETDLGRLLLRVSGSPEHRPGDEVSWSLRRSWPLA